MTRVVPGTSRKPPAVPLAMSSAEVDTPAQPTESPIPLRPNGKPSDEQSEQKVMNEQGTEDLSAHPDERHGLPFPKLRLEVRDLDHNGATAFFNHVHPRNILSDVVAMVLQTLYFGPGGSRQWPAVRSITLVLRSMPGVAYTTGSELDNEHKEIHFSLDHIANQPPERQKNEIHGVLAHEMVHVWQWNGEGTCPGGLIEGIADWVRLRDGLAPPHWKRQKRDQWDAGYETTGYFLDWLEQNYGASKVKEMNAYLGQHRYYEETFWRDMFKKPVAELWKEYNTHLPTE